MIPTTNDKMKWAAFPWEEQLCRRFSLAEIELATQKFDEGLVIGRGGFGKVYRGVFADGSSAAIKRLDSGSKQGASEFWAEIEMLSKLRHCHLVSLIGYCSDDNEMLLVYELMPRGTLGDHLYKLGTRLPWLQRLKICIGAARGLDYLHTGTGTHHGVIHRDVKSSNILLDDNWEAKISDFGLSKVGPTNQQSTFVSTAVKGTFGYLDPEYFSTGRLTRKSDVYAFGVVLLEVLCGRRAVDKSLDEEQWGLAGWAQDCIKEGKLLQIIDCSLNGQILLNCSNEFAQIAQRCLHNRPKERPTMAEVVVGLEFALALQERLDYSEPDYAEPYYAATTAEKITFTRKIQKFFFPSTVHVHASPSGKKGKINDGKSFNAFSNDNLVLNNDENISQKMPEGGRIVTLFTLAELKKATRNFSPEMSLGNSGGNSGFWKGWVDKDTYVPSMAGAGMPVAVKKPMVDSISGHKEWQAEVNLLGKVDHPNVIALLGYCIEDLEFLQVYEFMENGSLHKHLFTGDSSKTLPWAVRLNIMIEAARGLAVLHRKYKVIHRDFKSDNILLDGNYNAKVSGFGLARCSPEDNDTHVTTRVLGTRGFAAPEYVATGHLYVKSDVYSFGVVLLEVLTGQRALDQSRQGVKENLVDWTTPLLTSKRKLRTIMDPRLEHDYPMEGAIQVAKLVRECLQQMPKDRPSMEEVVKTLKQISAFKI